MNELKTSKTVRNIANLSIYLIIYIFLISPILPDKIIYDLILLTGIISLIGFILLVKDKEKKFSKGF